MKNIKTLIVTIGLLLNVSFCHGAAWNQQIAERRITDRQFDELSKAVQFNNILAMRHFIQANPSALTLSTAVFFDNPNLINELIAAGAIPNRTNSLGDTALHLAVTLSTSNDTMHALINGGINIFAVNEEGLLPAELMPYNQYLWRKTMQQAQIQNRHDIIQRLLQLP